MGSEFGPADALGGAGGDDGRRVGGGGEEDTAAVAGGEGGGAAVAVGRVAGAVEDGGGVVADCRLRCFGVRRAGGGGYGVGLCGWGVRHDVVEESFREGDGTGKDDEPWLGFKGPSSSLELGC